MKHILKCAQCGEYAIKEKCKCGGKAVNPKPAKYSPDDKMAEYQRKAKEKERKERGLL